jgi:protein SCO1/2
VNRRRVVGSALALAAAATIAATAFVSLGAQDPDTGALDFEATDVTGVNWGRDFHLAGDDGAPHELAEFRGKVVALYFGYTRCPDVCPLTLATLAESVRLLGEDGKRVQVIFVTVDPKHDKPELLARYVRSFHDGFLALYGDAAATARTAAEFKVEGGEHHSTPVFLFDPGGQLRLVAHPEASAESIAHDIRALLVPHLSGRAQLAGELAHVGESFEVAGKRDDAFHRRVGQEARGGGAQLLLDLAARQRIGRVALRRRAAV